MAVTCYAFFSIIDKQIDRRSTNAQTPPSTFHSTEWLQPNWGRGYTVLLRVNNHNFTQLRKHRLERKIVVTATHNHYTHQPPFTARIRYSLSASTTYFPMINIFIMISNIMLLILINILMIINTVYHYYHIDDYYYYDCFY